MGVDPRYREYFKLFNQERFFEAHEVLEDLWRETRGSDRDFYQGLIQVAAVFVHLQKKTPGGAQKLLKSASRYLEKYGRRYRGVDVVHLLKVTEQAVLEQEAFPKLYLK